MAHARTVATLILGAAMAAGCRGTPTAPAAPAAVATSGSWRGIFEITSCTSTGAGACERYPQAFTLHTTGSQGVLVLDLSEFADQPPVAVDLTLTSSGAGVIAAGMAELPRLQLQPQQIDVRLELTATEPSLAGSIRYTLTSQGTGETREGRILSAARDTAFRPGSFQGTWAGRARRTQCSGGCEVSDPILWSGALMLHIAQSGSSVNVRFNSYDLTGTVSGSVLTAAGSFQLPESQCRWFFDSGPVCMWEIRIAATADQLQRLRGTMTYKADTFDWRRQRYQMEGVADLSGLARWQ